MKLIRFLTADSQTPRLGLLQPDGSAECVEANGRARSPRVSSGGAEETALPESWFEPWQPTGRYVRVDRLLAPLRPPVILCVGLNFRAHAEETGQPIPDYPVLFMKSPWVTQNPGDPILIPTRLPSTKVDYEAELVVILGKDCKNATRGNALDYVLGYTCGNDVTARDWQKSFGGNQWCRGKSFDTFAPLGPCIVTPDELPASPQDLTLKTIVNGEVRQCSSTADQIFSVVELIVFLSGSTTLPAGTAIFTGTPSGAGFAMTPPRFLKEGDVVTVSIDGIGELTNPVALEGVSEITCPQKGVR
ncbi:MAG: fumarylacetoacetate hydrolase family protein [Kiritimatiellaeota bacterium]|nr:fumarylacetoacetate hydrolase family protein [Kiritimatiellota bacterium]